MSGEFEELDKGMIDLERVVNRSGLRGASEEVRSKFWGKSSE